MQSELSVFYCLQILRCNQTFSSPRGIHSCFLTVLHSFVLTFRSLMHFKLVMYLLYSVKYKSNFFFLFPSGNQAIQASFIKKSIFAFYHIVNFHIKFGLILSFSAILLVYLSIYTLASPSFNYRGSTLMSDRFGPLS